MGALIICSIFTKLLNKCFKKETFPDVFKVSQIIPLPKLNVPSTQYFQILQKPHGDL